MVHRTFKNFAPHTNKKEIDFDLIKRYNIVESLRCIYDELAEEATYKNCKDLFSGWYMTNEINNIAEGKLKFIINLYFK